VRWGIAPTAEGAGFPAQVRACSLGREPDITPEVDGHSEHQEQRYRVPAET